MRTIPTTAKITTTSAVRTKATEYHRAYPNVTEFPFHSSKVA